MFAEEPGHVFISTVSRPPAALLFVFLLGLCDCRQRAPVPPRQRDVGQYELGEQEVHALATLLAGLALATVVTIVTAIDAVRHRMWDEELSDHEAADGRVHAEHVSVLHRLECLPDDVLLTAVHVLRPDSLGAGRHCR